MLQGRDEEGVEHVVVLLFLAKYTNIEVNATKKKKKNIVFYLNKILEKLNIVSWQPSSFIFYREFLDCIVRHFYFVFVVNIL